MLRLTSIWRSHVESCSWFPTKCLRKSSWTCMKKLIVVRWRQVRLWTIFVPLESRLNKFHLYSLVNLLAQSRYWWCSILANKSAFVSHKESRPSKAGKIFTRRVLWIAERHSGRCSKTSKHRQLKTAGSNSIAIATEHRSVEKESWIKSFRRRAALWCCRWRWLCTRSGSCCTTGKIVCSWVKEH